MYEVYEAAIVVGHSLGAQIALHLAATHPQRVRALALIDPVVPEALTSRRRRLKRMRPLFGLASRVLRALNALGLKRREFPLMNLEALDEETRAVMRGAHPQRELVKRYSALGLILEYMPTANYLQQIMATVAPLPRLEAVNAPTLVLESAGVDFMGRARSRAELARLPHLELIEIDATHWPLTERPDEVRHRGLGWAANGSRNRCLMGMNSPGSGRQGLGANNNSQRAGCQRYSPMGMAPERPRDGMS
jgi:pimeloyl-ACP methyl ester carboxylesterase